MRKKLNGRVLAGLVILSVVLLVALLAPVLAPHDPYELGVPYLRPSAEHPLGTNDIGQDILSELIYGTRISLLIGVVSALAVTVVGTALGILSGYLGGWTDQIIMQVTNVAMALPSLPLTIILVAFLDASVWNIILAICITAWTSTARIIRSRVQQLKALPFIQIERTMGASGPYIMIRHILPNLGEIVFIRAVLSVGSAMLTDRPQLSGSGCKSARRAGAASSIMPFSATESSTAPIGGMCRPSCASRSPCLGLCC